MEIYISLLVCLVGLLMYALAANAKVVEIGRTMMWTGMLAFLLAVGSGRVFPIGHP
jgi:hypothetical protein